MAVPIASPANAIKISPMLLKRQYRLHIWVMASIVISVVLLVGIASKTFFAGNDDAISPGKNANTNWQAPDTSLIPSTPEGALIRYGRDLIANTAVYLGPKGKIAAISNGMNCQNCHLDAGTRIFGNNYSGVYSTYPRFRERSGTVENIYKRVNDCIERSLNGKRGLDTNSREMQAIYSYIKWLGQDVPKGSRPGGAGIVDLPFLDRPAEPSKGEKVYIQSCQRCHGIRGEGLLNEDQTRYVYPPLWGQNSYTTAAGLYRISRFAGYVKYNMPFDASHTISKLTDEEAWDVAAFVNTQPRPVKNYKQDWPDISGKPIDYPFGPYEDSFSEMQHKYGPFDPIRKLYQRKKSKL